MIVILDVALVAVAVALLVPTLVLLIECLMALLPGRARRWPSSGPRPSVAVLIPAHNEELAIETAIRSVTPQLGSGDRLVVVADNCSDRTADIARKAGAVVIERHDTDRRGKGHAVNYGLRFLAADPPQVIVMLDADCVVSPDTVVKIAVRASESGRPVQARFEVEPRSTADHRAVVSAFAYSVRGFVRSSGLERLGLPCQLAGSGMAFPWSVLTKVSFAGDNLVEDLQLGVEVALTGHPARYCSDAQVSTSVAGRWEAVVSQRRRWEHGHLSTLVVQGPRLVAHALTQRRLDLLALALDLCVPPLSLLVLVGTAAMAAAVLVGGAGVSWTPLWLLVLDGVLFVAAMSAAWFKVGPARLPLAMLMVVPFYVLTKIPLYWAFLVRRQKAWVRNARDNER
jgi:cellulose synthase/poly-beta-1,6-N-acetylglucosamine synthase-like glycosyltransferase